MDKSDETPDFAGTNYKLFLFVYQENYLNFTFITYKLKTSCENAVKS